MTQGDFDDCQAIVKQAFADVDFRDSIKLGAINSINWARVLAQITYYFYSWLRVTDSVVGPHKPALNFAVPTGNFGDILAGYYAKRMGLAVNKLVISTNQNDVLHRFFETGVYNKHPAVLTIAPSMDISISSNFERYLYYLAEESSRTLAAWMNTFESTGRLTLAPHLLKKAKEDFLSAKATEQEIVDTMKVLFLKENYLVCPHTATAVHAIKALNLNALSSVCLATAHPAKFEQAINMAIPPDEIPDRPEELSKLFRLPTRSFALENSLASVKNFIRTKLPGAKKQDWAALFTTVNMLLFTAAAVAAGIYLSRRAGNK